jgi:NADPH:quinone reductase-like Zn-dependent oxidoreductase
MKAVVVARRFAGLEALEMREMPVPAPKPNEVLVRVRAASINDWDWELLRESAWLDRAVVGLSSRNVQVLGCDIAGCVEAVGGDVTTLQPGDEVYGDLCTNGFGGFAEYVCAPAAVVARKPAGMTFEQAAAIPQAGMLAVQGLIDAGGIQPGQSLLVNGAGGGVGTFALQIAKLYDAEITAVDKSGKLPMLRALGAHHVVDFLAEDFTERGDRYDLILDIKTTRSPFACARALKRGGTYATVGGSLPRLLQALALGPVISSMGGKRVRLVGLRPNKDLGYMNELFEAGKLAPVIEGPYELSEWREAFRLFGDGDHQGKIVVKIS